MRPIISLMHCDNCRNLHKWVERLKKELPYYEECSAGQSVSLSLVTVFLEKQAFLIFYLHICTNMKDIWNDKAL